jgi:hypothetical protein
MHISERNADVGLKIILNKRWKIETEPLPITIINHFDISKMCGFMYILKSGNIFVI